VALSIESHDCEERDVVIRVYDFDRAPVQCIDAVALDDGSDPYELGVAMVVYDRWDAVGTGCGRPRPEAHQTGRTLRFVDIGSLRLRQQQQLQRQQQRGGRKTMTEKEGKGAGSLAVVPVQFPLCFDRPQDMTVVGDRLWMADGPSLRCFALSLEADGGQADCGPVRLMPLADSRIDRMTPSRIDAVGGGGGVRMFVSGSVRGEHRTLTCLVADGAGAGDRTDSSVRDRSAADSKAPGSCGRWHDVRAVRLLTAWTLARGGPLRSCACWNPAPGGCASETA
jgi:hypothetical protein